MKMIEYKTTLKSWGNSIGLIIPKEDLTKENLHINQEVKVMILPIKPLKVKDIFGKLKLKRSTERILQETDKELDSKFF